MARKKKPTYDSNVTPELLEQFRKEAVRWQEKSRCDCPRESQLASMVARKYLFFVLDNQHQFG